MERLYTELEILNQPNIHILTAFIYVKKKYTILKKKRQRQEEKSGKHAILRIIWCFNNIKNKAFFLV